MGGQPTNWRTVIPKELPTVVKILSPTSGFVAWGSNKGTTATATAKSLQLCPTLGNPIDDSPPGSPIPGNFLHLLHYKCVAITLNGSM